MKRSTLIPVQVSRTFSKNEKPLNPDLLPSYLKELSFSSLMEFETVYVPISSKEVYPVTMSSLTCLPVFQGNLVPSEDYVRSANKITFNKDKYADNIVYLYRPKITYGSGSERNDNLNYRNDTTASVYLKVGQSIQDMVTLSKPFRVTIPYENKPDKIADKVYNDNSMWWIIMQYNGLIYPTDVTLDSVLLVPDLDQVNAWLKVIQPSSSNSLQYVGQRVRL